MGPRAWHMIHTDTITHLFIQEMGKDPPSPTCVQRAALSNRELTMGSGRGSADGRLPSLLSRGRAGLTFTVIPTGWDVRTLHSHDVPSQYWLGLLVSDSVVAGETLSAIVTLAPSSWEDGGPGPGARGALPGRHADTSSTGTRVGVVHKRRSVTRVRRCSL